MCFSSIFHELFKIPSFINNYQIGLYRTVKNLKVALMNLVFISASATGVLRCSCGRLDRQLHSHRDLDFFFPILPS